MAQFPCSRCGRRYRGPQQTAYPALLNGVTGDRRRMRLCPDDFEALDQWCEKHLLPSDQESGLVACDRCGKEVELPFAVFVTMYAAHDEREDWWGRSCAACADMVALALFGTQEPLPEG